MSVGSQLRRQLSPEYRDESLKVLRRIVEAIDTMKFQRHQDGSITVEVLGKDDFLRFLSDLERARCLVNPGDLGVA